jgi:hypothetical protein
VLHLFLTLEFTLTTLPSAPISGTNFTVHSLSPNIPDYTIYLAPHLQAVLVPDIGNTTNGPNRGEYYHRLSITRPDPRSPTNLEHLAIDIDIPSHIWRILRLNATDSVNAYLATGYKSPSSLTHLPTFYPVSETLISNGTFTHTSKQEKHMYIPELNIGITNMHSYIHSCDIEPFIKIFQNLSPYWSTTSSTSTPSLLPADQAKFMAALDEPWDSKKKLDDDHEVVMRTASFGHGRQKLDICIREDGEMRSGEEVSVGVYEDLWVPFAILAAYRERGMETGSRDNYCGQTDNS